MVRYKSAMKWLSGQNWSSYTKSKFSNLNYLITVGIIFHYSRYIILQIFFSIHMYIVIFKTIYQLRRLDFEHPWSDLGWYRALSRISIPLMEPSTLLIFDIFLLDFRYDAYFSVGYAFPMKNSSPVTLILRKMTICLRT